MCFPTYIPRDLFFTVSGGLDRTCRSPSQGMGVCGLAASRDYVADTRLPLLGALEGAGMEVAVRGLLSGSP